MKALTRHSRGAPVGSSFVEILAALSIVGIALLVMLQQLTISYRENNLGQEKVFAYQKVLAILAELQASVERGGIRDGVALDALEDTSDNPVLTTLTDGGTPLAPDHPMSGNLSAGGTQWQWYRRLYVQHLPASERMRYVRIEVKRRGRDGKVRTVAESGGLLNLPISPAPTVKEYDVYLLAITSTPSMWMQMSSLRSLIQTATDEISARNPGLSLRLHWITELGYGRDELYAPYVNKTDRADLSAPWVYWYPGKLGDGSASTTLFTAEYFRGRIRTEGGFENDYHTTDNPYPHAVADQFNHAMRLPRARALFDQRVSAGDEDPTTPPLQLLLEDMHASPERFQNAILINLHGEGLPFPPLRNYSDAAKDPAGHPGVRVVTHPARLRPARDPNGDDDHSDSEDMEFRVYAYKTNPSSGPTVLTDPITVQIMGVDLTGNVNGAIPPQPTTLELRRLQGGPNRTTASISLEDREEYSGFDSSEGAPPVFGSNMPYEMAYQIGYVATPVPYTWIRLYNTPVVAPLKGLRGLDGGSRLYGMEYIPSPVQSGGGFPIDLSTVAISPKNSARWRIRIPKAAFEPGFPGGSWTDEDTIVTVVTRIGTDLGTGVTWPAKNQPGNRAETYSWWASSPLAVPLTERFQLLGDPRHNPYADLVTGGSSFPEGYNCYFDDLRFGAVDVTWLWPCLDDERIHDGFGPGVIADLPRMAQVWREALQASSSVFANTGGKVAGALLLGGEIALPPAPGSFEPMPVPLFGEAYGQSTLVLADSVSQDYAPLSFPAPASSVTGTNKIGSVVVTEIGSTFWVQDWLGELAPDSAFGQFEFDGNLPTGLASGDFQRELRSEAVLSSVPLGTSFGVPSGCRLGDAGGATVIQIGDDSTSFANVVQGPGQTISLCDDGREILIAAGIGMPDTTTGRMPYSLSHTLSAALPHLPDPGFPAHFAQELQVLAEGASELSGSGVVRLLAPSGQERAFFAVLGDTPVTVDEHDRLARTAMLFALRAFHVAGEPAFDNQFDQLPRVIFTSPAPDDILEAPVNLLLRWRTLFKRFDGERYTAGYPAGFGGSEDTLAYVLMYSGDEGLTWLHAVDDSIATPGRKPQNPTLLQIDAGVGDESFLLALPDPQFPTGDYLFRVESYHRTRDLHFSHHQVNVRIER